MTTDMLRQAGFTGYVDVFGPDIPSAIIAEIIAERNRRCAVIAEALASAHGGLSQVSPADIGRAVAGQVRNNGLGCYGSAEDLIMAVYEASLFAGDGHYPADEPDDNVLPDAVRAYYAAGGEDSLPQRHYVPTIGGY